MIYTVLHLPPTGFFVSVLCWDTGQILIFLFYFFIILLPLSLLSRPRPGIPLPKLGCPSSPGSGSSQQHQPSTRVLCLPCWSSCTRVTTQDQLLGIQEQRCAQPLSLLVAMLRIGIVPSVGEKAFSCLSVPTPVTPHPLGHFLYDQWCLLQFLCY